MSFVNNKRGLSTEVQPNPTVLAGVIYFETDTGTIYLSNGVTTTKTQGPDKIESYTNKILDAEKNIIDTTELIEDYPFNENSQLKGGIIPAATTPDSFYGNLSGIDVYNPDSTIVTNDGILTKFTSTTFKDKLGFGTPSPIAYCKDNYSIAGEFKASALKIMVGFSNKPEFDPNLVLGNYDKGVAIGYTKLESNFTVYSNDGSGTRIATPFPVVKDGNLHKFEIFLGSTIICKLDGGNDIALVTRIPSLTDPLYLLSYGIN